MNNDNGLAVAIGTTAVSAMQAETRLFSNALSVEEFLPVEFRVVQNAMVATSGVVARSERALAAMRLFEDGAAELADADFSDPILRRMDAKLNVLLDAMCDWMRASHSAPMPCGLRLSRNGLRVDSCVQGFDIGVRGMVRIVLSQRFPQAIEIPAIGIACERSGNGRSRCWLEFDAPGESLILALERYLFRAHRRIAGSRHSVGHPSI